MHRVQMNTKKSIKIGKNFKKNEGGGRGQFCWLARICTTGLTWFDMKSMSIIELFPTHVTRSASADHFSYKLILFIVLFPDLFLGHNTIDF